jgi:hypothetical protein
MVCLALPVRDYSNSILLHRVFAHLSQLHSIPRCS